MTEASQQQFLVLYCVPTDVMADWAQTDPAIREPREAEMRAAWGEWMRAHGHMIRSSEAGGATKRVTSTGVADARNDIMLSAHVAASSHAAAAAAFENHPHLQIPKSYIEVMQVRPMGGL
jgi:hypothetical protein